MTYYTNDLTPASLAFALQVAPEQPASSLASRAAGALSLAEVRQLLTEELGHFQIRGDALALAGRVAWAMAPVWDEVLPPQRLSEARLPSGLARASGQVLVWRVTAGGLAPHQSGAEIGFQVSFIHGMLLMAPMHTGLPLTPGRICGCDDPRTLALWFPTAVESLHLELWRVDPAALWSDHALQVIFEPGRAERLACVPYAACFDLISPSVEAFCGQLGQSETQDHPGSPAEPEFFDLGFVPGGLHARWEMAAAELISAGVRPEEIGLLPVAPEVSDLRIIDFSALV